MEEKKGGDEVQHARGFKVPSKIQFDIDAEMDVAESMIISPRVWVIQIEACEGVCKACVGGPIWHTHVIPQGRGQSPTWTRMVGGIGHRQLMAPVQSREGAMDSSKSTLNAALGTVRTCKHKVRWRTQNSECHTIYCRAANNKKWILWWRWPSWVQQADFSQNWSRVMASPSLPLGKQRHGDCHCSRCLGEHHWDDKGKSVDEGQSRDSRGGMLVENCFNAENSATDRRILAILERELQVAFRFDDDSGRLVNLVWWSESCQGDSSREDFLRPGNQAIHKISEAQNNAWDG